MLEKPVFLHNTTHKILKLRDIDLKILPKDTVEFRKYVKHMPYEEFAKSLREGSCFFALKQGSLIISYLDQRNIPKEMPMVESRRVVPRRSSLAPPQNKGNSNFIERIQAEFGDKILETPESEIVKNTSDLINSIDFDGVGDFSDFDSDD